MASKPNQVPVINTLRAIAALMVCVFHFSWHRDKTGLLYDESNPIQYFGWQGHIGVYVFFVISGFVIPLSMWYGRYHIINFFRFVAKRLLRLHPPFLATLAIMAVMAICFAIKDNESLILDWSRIIHNFFLTAKFFDEDWYQDVYWTLAIEFQYYLLIGLLYPLFILNRTWISVLLFIPFILSAHLFDHDTGKHVIFYHAPVFAMGIALFLYHVKKISGLVLVLLIAVCMVDMRFEISPEVAVACTLTAYAIAVMTWHGRIVDFLGKISYSLYLIHGLTGGQFLYFTARYAHNFWTQTLLLLAALAVSIFFAWIFYRVVEEPSIRWSQLVKYRKREA